VTAADASLAALLTVERAARVRLSATVRRVGRQVGTGAAPDVLVRGAHAIERGVAEDVALIRAAARSRSAATLAAEMAAARVRPLSLPARRGVEAADQAEATAAAKAFAAAWLGAALAAGSDDAEDAEPDNLDARADGLATTQTASAFGAEREDITNAYAREAHARGLVIPFKRWDATHDKKLCARCRDLARSTPRPWGVDFPGGAVPGLVHPRCRCELVTAALPLAWRAEAEEATTR